MLQYGVSARPGTVMWCSQAASQIVISGDCHTIDHGGGVTMMPKRPNKRADERPLKGRANPQAALPIALAAELLARLEAITNENTPALAILHEMEQLIAGASDQQKLAAFGPRRHDMISALQAMRVQLANLMETVAEHVGQPLSVMGNTSSHATAAEEQFARAVAYVVTTAKAIDRALAVLQVTTERPETDTEVFRDGLASMPSYHVLLGVLEAIHAGQAGQGWTDNDWQTVPMRPVYDGKGSAYLSVRGPDGDRRPATAVIRSLWAKVRELDDLTSDVLLYCLCCWATRTSSPGEFVWVSADRVLDERGVQRKRYRSEGLRWQHGHRRDDRLAVWQALVRLKDLWIEMLDVEVLPARRGRKAQFVRVESPLLLTDARMTQHDLENDESFLAAQVAPGRWARELWEVLGPQTGLLARKALEYDPYRERPEKRLAKYLAFHVRRNAQWHLEEFHLRVSTLLEAVGDAIPADPSRPGRTKDRLDKALDRLAADLVIGRWAYVDVPDLPARGWLDQWLSWRVVISPTDNVIAHYSAMKLPKPRTSSLASLPASDRDAMLVEPVRHPG